MENKKTKAKKNITKPVKKNYKKDLKSTTEIIPKMRKLKKRNYADNRNKNMSDEDREKKNNI